MLIQAPHNIQMKVTLQARRGNTGGESSLIRNPYNTCVHENDNNTEIRQIS